MPCQRKFPHDEAAALFQAGWKVAAIAVRYGVVENTVYHMLARRGLFRARGIRGPKPVVGVEELARRLATMPVQRVAEELCLSDQAVRQRAQRWGLTMQPARMGRPHVIDADGFAMLLAERTAPEVANILRITPRAVRTRAKRMGLTMKPAARGRWWQGPCAEARGA